ncbi:MULTISPECIES: PEP-CTERM sorting domain-containing protein [Nostoc]|uniref:PEP-CTERM sorting domain-containing protein n=1 Tax=Nostoc paludosum FACHB-159 TaxID=2692908 RepID=A0ABR8KBC5_9NOSO|nr:MULTISPECIES: PEP-CTERM sorting domain-containing protein [Nostoc]MBD2679034.1 PEP-CTERM sorting domain-containing protein [Nostoc sp. FACHB-857]MBD2735412.1 PEP-CTERM sorting domain-containing protein [Nostoc paludosum FACHB-159]
MKLTKQLSIIAFSVTTTLISTAAIANTYNAAQAVELVKNGGFELDSLVDPNNPNTTNPNITDWAKFGDPIDTTLIKMSNFPKTGNQGLSLGGFVDLSYISQTLSTQPGQQYELSYYLASTADPSDLDNQFQAFVGGNKIFDQTNISFQDYTSYKFNFTADSSSTELKFGSVDRQAFFYLDDVSVKSVPEPSTIGGVAVAVCIGMWLKKKKAIS